MTYEYPDISRRLEQIKKAIEWSSKVKVVWIDQNDGGRIRETNSTWVELRPKKIINTGTRDVRHVDLETALTEGTLEYPRQEVSVRYKKILCEARAKSRTQQHASSAWYALLQLQDRIISEYAKMTWLKPYNIAIGDIGDVINMPVIAVNDNRVEDVANLEISFNTVLHEYDESNVGSWIDRCLVSSNLITIDNTLQLNNVVMGFADETHLVDGDGNYIQNPYNNMVINGG